ncbi:hypothetical protein P168DRAFT_301113 [Aspergillus campestris IBT 28561]|uniref:Cell wall protein n=1 Tax=Aspergillus campestris (strain IBT 28561) TaxID=1392248 RepID=A0A2I1DEV0_ASPC2|nr:uncharacterized protein P168DRAFT_301113 [Aspergillus campestris IBT 28561]PKY08405.1 hypothetical protein P168DRAFT_301113 [Aspergillus campestris IBT 28561]
MASIAPMKYFFLLAILLFTVIACAQDSIDLGGVDVADEWSEFGSPASNIEIDEIDGYLSKLDHILPRAETVTVVSTDTICSSELVPTAFSSGSVTHQTSAAMPGTTWTSVTPGIPETSVSPGTTSTPVGQGTTVISGNQGTTLTSAVAPTAFPSPSASTVSPPVSSGAHSVTHSPEPSSMEPSTKHSTTNGPTTTAPRSSHTSAPAPAPNAATAQGRVDMTCLAIAALFIGLQFV